MDLSFSALSIGKHLIPLTLTASPSGGWSWFSDPRAIYANGTTFFGYAADISGDQSLEVRSYDHATATVSSAFVLHTTASNSEDHGPPTLLRRSSDGRIRTFYHNSDAETIMYTRLSTNPDDLSAWGAQTDITSQVGAGVRWFFNPVELTGETNSPISVFYTQETVIGDPRIVGFTRSTDGGTTWAANTSLYQTSQTWSYFKVAPNGATRIDFAVTDNHPDRGATSIYHFYYQGGNYYKSDGTQITASLPFDESHLTKIYDGASISGWIWDIAIDPNTGFPVVVFATFPTTSDHRYQYAAWNGSAWSVHQICTAGGGSLGGQPHYSGGVVLDHTNPAIVYASRQITSQFEVWKFFTPDSGVTWQGSALTQNSASPQIRPVSVRSHADDLRVLWLSGTYTTYNAYSQGLAGA